MLTVGLGCMRLSTAEPRDEGRARAVLHAALDAGVRLFDTAHAYGLDEADLGHNERWVAAALAAHPAGAEATVVTKGGMARPGGRWVPDGRASTLEAQAEASARALGRPPDLYLVHAPDPKVAWSTTVRALARLQARGVVKAVGLSNVSLAQLEQALELAPVTAVEVALSPLEDGAVRSGVVARCAAGALRVLAHSPLGGVKRAGGLLAHAALRTEAARLGASPAAVALAGVLALQPGVQVLPGARRPETARDAAGAAGLALDAPALERLRTAFPALRPPGQRAAAGPAPAAAAPGGLPNPFLAAPPSAPSPPRRTAPAPAAGGEVVLVMGLQGAGKSELVREWEARGYRRLNRDLAGGTLEALAREAGQLLAAGTRRLVLDNTYVTRAARAQVLDVAARAGVPVRGLWLDIPLHEAQVNVILRMLAAHGRLLEPEAMRAARNDNTALGPQAPLRLWRTLEAPAAEEGFAALEVRPFARRPWTGRPGRYAALELGLAGAVPFGWRPQASAPELEALRARGALVCAHPGGPPACWCRPPLPGLLLAHAVASGVDPAASEVHGTSEAHQVLAAVLGATYVAH